MNTLELEAKKAELAREILGETEEKRVSEWLVFLRSTMEKKVTTIVPETEKQSGRLKATTPRAGCMKGTFTWMSDDFNEPLDDFNEYQ